MKRATWIWIVVGGLAAAVLLFIVLVAGTGFYFYARHVDIQRTDPATAAREFETTRQRFAGQTPLLRIEDNRTVVNREERLADRTERHQLEAIHLLIWAPDDEQVVRLSIPMWLVRLGRGGNIRIGGDGHGRSLEDLNLTVHDLERAGPGLILEHEERDGTRLLVWSQ